MMTMFLQSVPEATLVEKILSTENIALLVLAVGCVVLWRAWSADRKENDSFLKELLRKGQD